MSAATLVVTPLDPDGPKPGETWVWIKNERNEDVVVLTTPSPEGNVFVRYPNKDWEMTANVRDLSPIKPTRTVTVELTENEAYVAQCILERHARDAASELGRSALHKLAEALEDS